MTKKQPFEIQYEKKPEDMRGWTGEGYHPTDKWVVNYRYFDDYMDSHPFLPVNATLQVQGDEVIIDGMADYSAKSPNIRVVLDKDDVKLEEVA